MGIDHIRYDLLCQEALRNVVRSVLADAAKKGLPADHHFFISFDTRADGVRVSARLREQYPDEMTIVLQHQFWDLKVGEDEFEVGLSFNGVPEKLVVPFAALKSFVDPSVQFALQFERVTETQDNAPPVVTANADKPRAAKSGKESAREPRKSVPSVPRVPPSAPAAAAPAAETAPPAPADGPPDKPDKPKRGGEVVRLDRFRKK